LDPMLIIGAVSNLAGLVTFLDWAVIKSRAKKQKQPLDRSQRTLEKLEESLKGISVAVKEKKDLFEVKHYVDLLNEAKADLIRDLQKIGIEIPKEEAPKVRGFSDEALLTMVNVCESSIIRAKNELSKV